MLSAYFADPYTKITDNTTKKLRRTHTLCLAKNDTESFQIVLRARASLADLTLCVLPETDAALKSRELSVSFFAEDYARTKDGARLPDALPPLGVFSLPANKNIPIFVKVHTRGRARAGRHTLVIGVRQKNTERLSLRVTVKLWDFVLPTHFSCESSVGLRRDILAKWLGLTDRRAQNSAYRRYYDFLLGFGLSCYDLPYPIESARADRYLSDERVSSFVVPYSEDDAKIRAAAAKLSANPAWCRKALSYLVDEPMTVKQLNTLSERSARMKKLFPQTNVIAPLHRDVDVSATRDSFAFLKGKVDIWCPKAALFSDSFYSEEQKKRFAPLAARMAAAQRAKDRLWWYVCCEPAQPYCNLLLDMPGLCGRVLFWQQALYGVEGFLYWCANFWTNSKKPREIAPFYSMNGTPVYGDGVLVYADESGAPLSSLRLEIVRDGMEDFEYLMMAKRLLGAEKMRDLILPVTTDVLHYTEEADLFNQAREALGDAIEGACGSALH